MAQSKRRRFGKIQQQRSGRYQASYVDPLGVRRYAPDTFKTRTEANDWLTTIEADLLRRTWQDPDRGKIKFALYAETWIPERPNLRPRTVELYEWLYQRYLKDHFGNVFLSDIDPGMIRRWRSRLMDENVSATMVAKAYRLLRAVLMTAVDDELIKRNPCRIKGAGTENPAERPVLTVDQVYALADRMPERYRVMILTATFLSLRYGEVTALQRRHIDIEDRTVRVQQAYGFVRGRGLVLGPTKSKAGDRIIGMPDELVPELAEHLDKYTGQSPDALVFTHPSGKPIARGNFNPTVGWAEAVTAIGMPGFRFHDLRHTGNTLAADSGASTRNLMARMGQDSPRAALIYQHASSQADRAIADAINARIKLARERRKGGAERGQGCTGDADGAGDAPAAASS